MQITLSFDNFTELPYTSGTIQNISSQATVEICQDDTVNSGLILGPGEWFSWSNSTVYARSAWDYEPVARCAVVPFKKGGEGGGSEYILPVATKNTLGGVKSSDEAGAIKVDALGKMTYNAPSSTPLSAPDWETNTAYPENALVEYNDNIYICLVSHTSGTFADDLANGKWKLVSMTLNAATSSELGGVKSNSADGGVTVASDGNMTINLPKATSSTLGGVKIGDGLSVTADGTLSATSTGGGISIWQANTEYEVNDVVIDSNLIWQCATAHTSTTTFDESKWVCISGGEISNGYETVTLFSGSYGVNNESDNTFNSTLQLSDSLSSCDFIYIKASDGTNKVNFTAIADLSDILPTKQLRVSFYSTNERRGSVALVVIDSTHIAIAWLDKGSDTSNLEINTIKGIRKAKPIVSSGMKYETLWEGEAGSLSRTGSTTINLSDNVNKYQKLGFTIKTKPGKESALYYREIDVDTYIKFIDGTLSTDHIGFYGGYSDFEDYVEINTSSTNTQVAFAYGRSLITKIIGISEGVVIPTGVQAARVTLWEGSYNTANSSLTSYPNTIALGDSIENYDLLEITINLMSGQNENNFNTSIFNVSDIKYNEASIRLTAGYGSNFGAFLCSCSDSTHFAICYNNSMNGYANAVLTKITGIKYIQPDSYSTDEKLIGTWIDGKPLYQKTMSVTTPSGSRGVIATIDANYSVREISGYIIESNANTFPINFSYSGYYVCACVLSSDITIFQNGYSNLPAYITLKYTKN